MLRARISLKATNAAGLGYSRPSSRVVKSPLGCWTGTVGASPTALVMMPTSLPSFSTRSLRSPETANPVRSESFPVGLKSRLTLPPTLRYPELTTIPSCPNQLPETR